jgi:hypothetical protein
MKKVILIIAILIGIETGICQQAKDMHPENTKSMPIKKAVKDTMDYTSWLITTTSGVLGLGILYG